MEQHNLRVLKRGNFLNFIFNLQTAYWVAYMAHLISVNMFYRRSNNSVNSASPVDLIDSLSPQTLTCHSRKNIGPANTYKGLVPFSVSVSHSSKQASTIPGPWNPSPMSLARPMCFLQWHVKMIAVKEFVCWLQNRMTCCLGWEITRGSKHCFLGGFFTNKSRAGQSGTHRSKLSCFTVRIDPTRCY